MVKSKQHVSTASSWKPQCQVTSFSGSYCTANTTDGISNRGDAAALSKVDGKEASDVSLVMGKEIYKDLYLSYGKNLTGADLIWSLEK